MNARVGTRSSVRIVLHVASDLVNSQPQHGGGGRTTAIMCNAVHALSTFPLKRRCEDTSLKRCTCVPSAWVNLVGATCLLLHLVHAAFCVCSCGELHLAGFRHALNFTAALLGLLEAGYFLGRISGLILDVAQYRVFAFS